MKLESCCPRKRRNSFPSKFAANDTLSFYFYLLKKIRLDVSCEFSA